ncbi:xanthine dehydrogenase family protein molybdopterin-binding subunit [Piscinibacter sakaiensis]|uniref:Isoquinoline 1-oxidoreductase, beta subunit n=2 Tax=Piscinibacter sakaiensis TaxID=1547922 RepID=A0A0K8NZS7_PISS1|nr:molybdopterin cofactor-binding domain-containing protein [Piscinibacter sakaiensis]GAP35886.1 isoquinoline 1-oxidoreductase, beta subunit [Piscinibacter sakaiensis]
MNIASLRSSRRGLLRAAGAGVAVGFLAGCTLPVIPKRPSADAAAARGWIRFADGRYTLFVPRVEMGQAILTALKQVACEELGIGWDQLDAVLPDTRQIARVRATVGSESVKDFALPLAQACATLRDALAAGVRTGELAAAERPVDALRSFSARAERRHVGRPVRLEQGLAIVRGQPLFAADVRRPGQVFGRVLRAPASPELRSRATAFDAAAARAVPGFVALVEDELLVHGASQGLGIVARTPGALDRIEAALAVQWQVEGSFGQPDIDAAVDIDRRMASGRLARQVHADRIEGTGPWDVDLRIDVPLAAHAAIEPRAAVAAFAADGRLELWVGTQDVFYQRDVVARRLALDEAKVVVHGQRVGGGFGGRTLCTVELEAAVLARAVRLPVKVQWTRAQEFRLGFHRPPSSHRIRARLKDGRIEQWWHGFASSHILFTNAALPPWLQRLTDLVGDDGVARGARLPYRAAARRTAFDLVRLPVFTGPWRGLGAGPNVFAIESAIDECARAAGVDAVAFRRANAEDPRLVRVLDRAAEAAGWAAADRRPGQRGRGVACGIYKAMSYAAVVAEVEVEPATGRIRVDRLVCAHDCGQVVNPDQVRAQCEGNLVWGLGMALVEQLPVAASQVSAAHFGDYPIPRIGEVPPIEVLLVDEGEPPTGAGETAIVAAAAAIANAVRAATGVRPQRLPIVLHGREMMPR